MEQEDPLVERWCDEGVSLGHGGRDCNRF
jgi:hypothetical protein